MLFLAQHLLINLTSIIPDNGKTFNAISHFMGYNPFVQFILQPILMFGVCFHFIMGLFIEWGNRKNQINYVDWVELIKFRETRNYVQRVLENYSVQICIGAKSNSNERFF